MLFDTDIEPASNLWRQPLQMRARNDFNVNGLDWENFHLPMDVDSVAFHDESNYLVAYGAKRDQCSIVQVTATSSSPKISVVETFNPPSQVFDMHWSAKNTLLCASSEGRVFRYLLDPLRLGNIEASHVYTLNKLKSTGRPGYSTRVRRVAGHPTDDVTFACLENGNVHIWDVVKGEINISKKISENVLTALSWSSHFQKRVMVGGFSRGLRLFDVKSGDVVWKKEDAHSIGLITDIAFHPYVPWWVASAGEDGVAKVWDLRCGARALCVMDEHFGGVHHIAWSPSHSEILATGSIDRQFKLWDLNLAPHYVIVNRKAEAPIAGAGFMKPLHFHSIAVSQNGEISVAKLSESFVEPLVPSLEGGVTGLDSGNAEIAPEREVAKLIYFRDFSVAFERAYSLAEKLSFQHKPELALAVLDLAYQRSTPDVDPNVHPDTPLAEALQNFQVELKNYSYFVPPGYHSKYGTQVKDEVMSQIQSLRLRLELQRAANLNMCSDILDRSKDIVELLEKDSKIIPPSLLTNLVQILMPHDLIQALDLAIEIADVLAISGDFNIFLPMARLLLFPTIYEPDLIYEHNDEKQEEKIKQTQSDERQLVDKLLNKNDILDQLSFMKKFYTKLWNEAADLVKFAEENQPDIIMSASVNRTYLNLLLAHNRFHSFYKYTTTLQKEIEGSKFAALISGLVTRSYTQLGAYIKTASQQEVPIYIDEKDKSKPNASVPALISSLAGLQTTIVTVLHILYEPAIFPFPDELSDILDQALKPLTQLLEKHFIQMLKIRESDPAKPPAKAAVAERAKEFTEQLKEITEGKKNNSDGVFSEKDVKRLYNSLAGFV